MFLWDCSLCLFRNVTNIVVFLIVSQFNFIWLCVAGIMSDETASTDALRRDDPVVGQSVPGEAVEAFPGEIIAPQVMEECRSSIVYVAD